jgi:hypothetical protein
MENKTLRERITYNILENGYEINLDGKPWIKQIEPYIPYRNVSYEESCLMQIEDLCKAEEDEQKRLDEITEMQLAIAELYEMVLGGNE